MRPNAGWSPVANVTIVVRFTENRLVTARCLTGADLFQETGKGTEFSDSEST